MSTSSLYFIKSCVKPLKAIITTLLVMTFCSKVYIPLPFTPVPINLGILGPLALSYGLGLQGVLMGFSGYILLLALGVPMSTHPLGIWGPTAGFLMGYLPMASLQAYFFQRFPNMKLIQYLAFSSLSLGVLYAFGFTGLAFFVPFTSLIKQLVFFFCVDMAKMSVCYPLYSYRRSLSN